MGRRQDGSDSLKAQSKHQAGAALQHQGCYRLPQTSGCAFPSLLGSSPESCSSTLAATDHQPSSPLSWCRLGLLPRFLKGTAARQAVLTLTGASQYHRAGWTQPQTSVLGCLKEVTQCPGIRDAGSTSRENCLSIFLTRSPSHARRSLCPLGEDTSKQSQGAPEFVRREESEKSWMNFAGHKSWLREKGLKA